MDQEIWRWTLTKEAIAPCFVRDVLAMRQHGNRDADFFWLGHTPCRTVLLVGMLVGVLVYDKRSIYTIDDGTAVIDCVLRHPNPAVPPPAKRSSPRPIVGPGAKSNPKHPSPKKPRLDKTKVESMEPPPPITEPGYPVRVVGRVVRHYQSKQIYADTIDPCPSSLDEITHLERVIELHKTKYSLAIPFVPPPKPTSRPSPLDTSTDADASVFSNTSPLGPNIASYTLPPPPMPMPVQSRSRPPSIPTHLRSTYQHVPSSPTSSSIASSTPSTPCKPSSPSKSREAPHKPKLRHPSRLHTRDLTGNTFRLYVKHYMDNAPSPCQISLPSPSRSTCRPVTTPTKRTQNEDEWDEPTPRPHVSLRNERRDNGDDDDDDNPTLGFTLSHLRRVPELALLAARVVRAEGRKRDKANREKDKESSHSRIPSSSTASAKSKGSGNGAVGAAAEPPRKKMKRLFSWAVVKLYEEGSIVLWDGDVRPLPVPPPPILEGPGERDVSGLWKGDDTTSTFAVPLASCSHSHAPSTVEPFASTSISSSTSASMLYASSASASLYSHYHPPRPAKRRSENESGKMDATGEVEIDADADSGNVSDPAVDEEAYVPLTPQLLAQPVREALATLRCGRGRGGGGTGIGGRATVPTPEDILAYLKRKDGHWARVGVWVVEEALAVLRTG